MQAWEMYKSNTVLQLVDPMLNGNFSETEAVRFLKVALLCVQEKCRFRPNMSTAIKMMREEINVNKMQITQPAFIADIMDVKIGRRHNSQSMTSSMCSPQLYPVM